MEERDRDTFDRALGRVAGVFQLRVKPEEWVTLTKTYFTLLEGYPIDAVLHAAKVCLRTLKHFPRPVEWLEVLDRPTATAPTLDVRQMTTSEVLELTDAETRRYERPACACRACVAAGVSGRPLRYVPTLDGETEERAYHPRRERIEIVGHWAHGEELRRWYVARAAFFQRATVTPIAPLLALVGREPGEEG